MLRSQRMATLLWREEQLLFHCCKKKNVAADIWRLPTPGHGLIWYSKLNTCVSLCHYGTNKRRPGPWGRGLQGGSHPREGQGSCWVLLLNRCSWLLLFFSAGRVDRWRVGVLLGNRGTRWVTRSPLVVIPPSRSRQETNGSERVACDI